jgi:hypothetical protein
MAHLVPYHCVVKVLLADKFCFYALVACSDETIKSNFMDCHKGSVPGLTDTHDAGSAAKVPGISCFIGKPQY